MKIALIDLGSNSARMYLTEIDKDQKITYLKRERVMTRLSQGMGTEGLLRLEPMQRTIEVLQQFAKQLQKEGAFPLATATAAVRKAVNGKEFCQAVYQQTGVCLHVISGYQEAFFDFQGVLASLPEVEDCLICDTGGGSTELILAKNRIIQFKTSLPFGAASLTEAYGLQREGADFQKAEEAVLASLQKTGILPKMEGATVVGLGGSAGALAELDWRMQGCPGEKPNPHGYRISDTRMDEIVHILRQTTPEMRQKEYHLEPGRAETICGGLLPLTVLLRQPCQSLQICTGGLREGILAMLCREGIENSLQDVSGFLKKFEE